MQRCEVRIRLPVAGCRFRIPGSDSDCQDPIIRFDPVIILKGSYHGAKLGTFERSLRDSYGLAGLMKGTHAHLPQGVGHTHLRDGCSAVARYR